ncbi:hypothetical protein SERLA73DRAFT_113838 [Serpula lacrymans var. lacrymans S7.3]|uniref:Uncharacterized protein n=1 Tax=Serpula lacrymans var. lacrymans (strain S7.3) TaxID=936435 RepID=F8Q922_SERL3|nr:hypothetical protein SERLA73DRAFT_113838 [Serpula lacrymans var. lacrymans S7.3]
MAATTPTMSPIDNIFDLETLSTTALSMESRPKPSRIKSCLKTPTPPRSASPTQGGKKTVVFSDEGTEEVYTADEWDRTPAEVAQRLSYQDILELKEIQRSLPKANQLPDPFSNRPHSQYLAKVPIGLLPLLPTSPAPPRAAPPPPPSQSRFARPPF